MPGEPEIAHWVEVGSPGGHRYSHYHLVDTAGRWAAVLSATWSEPPSGRFSDGFSNEFIQEDGPLELENLAPVMPPSEPSGSGLEAAVAELLKRRDVTLSSHVKIRSRRFDPLAFAALVSPWLCSRGGDLDGLTAALSRREWLGHLPSLIEIEALRGGSWVDFSPPQQGSGVAPRRTSQFGKPLIELLDELPSGVLRATGIVINDTTWLLPVRLPGLGSRLIGCGWTANRLRPATLAPQIFSSDYEEVPGGPVVMSGIHAGRPTMTIGYYQESPDRPGAITVSSPRAQWRR